MERVKPVVEAESAKALFPSDDYASPKELRRSCGTGSVVVVEGV